MKKVFTIISIVCLLIFLFSACTQESPETQAKTKDEAKTTIELLWTMEDIKHAEKLANEMGGVLLSYKTTMNVRPPFYQGEMPLEFVSVGKQLGGGGIMGSSIGMPFIYDFGAWRNYFIYRDTTSMIRGMPDGIIAVDGKTKQIVGECKVLEMLTKEGGVLAGFKLAENHFNLDGEAIFTSVFEVDYSAGVKTRELQSRGQKERDYFFIWPNGIGVF